MRALPSREARCAPGIERGRRYRIGGTTVVRWVMNPKVRALAEACVIQALPLRRARLPAGAGNRAI